MSLVSTVRLFSLHRKEGACQSEGCESRRVVIGLQCGRIWLEGETKINSQCERFGLECTAVNRAFSHYIDEPFSRPHEIRNNTHTITM